VFATYPSRMRCPGHKLGCWIKGPLYQAWGPVPAQLPEINPVNVLLSYWMMVCEVYYDVLRQIAPFGG
jgi:hypothetical protein